MQRILPSGIAAALALLALTLAAPACKDETPAAGDSDKQADKQAEPGKSNAEGANAADSGAGDSGAATGAEPTTANPEAGAAETGAGEAGAGEAAEAGAAEVGAAEAGTEPAEDVVPGLIAIAKDPKTEDDAAIKALDDAIAAGATKIDMAKIANERGEALMADGEGDRAEAMFVWAAAAHKLYSKPVYNLATLAAYAGDLEIAKQHLQELQKRGDKKLMKKVGVDPAFALLQDDADVRKIYEQ